MMDSKTGDLYPSIKEARIAFGNIGGTAKEARMNDLVEISGTEKAVKSISASVKADRNRKRKNKEARNSRRKNRK